MHDALYGAAEARSYLDGAPHLKHDVLHRLYLDVVTEAFSLVDAPAPRVLDLGAGEGGATSVFLERGASVTAVDDSAAQLDRLRRRGEPFGDRLEIVEARADEAIHRLGDQRYDIVAAISFLHHVPDYLSFVRAASDLVADGGVFLSFQDPLLHAELPSLTHAFQRVAYASWRLRKGDVVGGLRRRLRRARGEWDETCAQDVIEYHATRGGVDSDALVALLRECGFDPRAQRYFSTQSALFQRLGTAAALENTFALIAPRR